MPDESCIFCQVAAGTLPAPIVFEDERSIIVLDHRPLFPGHCLLIPRVHVETLGDLPDVEVAPLFRLAQRLSVAVEKGMQAEGSFVAMNNRVSQSVPHLHIHVVPRRKKDGLRGFFWPRGKYRDDSEAENARVAVRNMLLRLK